MELMAPTELVFTSVVLQLSTCVLHQLAWIHQFSLEVLYTIIRHITSLHSLTSPGSLRVLRSRTIDLGISMGLELHMT